MVLLRMITFPVHTWQQAGIVLAILWGGFLPIAAVVLVTRVTYVSFPKREARFKEKVGRKKPS